MATVFKVGDKVRRVREGDHGGMRLGVTVGIVERVNVNSPSLVIAEDIGRGIGRGFMHSFENLIVVGRSGKTRVGRRYSSLTVG